MELPDMYKYTKEELERQGNTVGTYEKKQYGGVVEIQYDLLDRGKGTANGFIAGGSAGLVGMFGSAALAVVFPPAAIGVLAMPLLTVGGGAVGAAVGANVHYSRYFDADSKILLGNDKTTAAKAANAKALEYNAEKNFAQAKDWFSKAHALCESDQKAIYKANMDNATAEDLNQRGEDLMSQDKYEEASKLFEQALSKCDKNFNEVTKLRQNLEKAKDAAESVTEAKTGAAVCFKSGQKSWNSAWKNEKADKSDEADANFKKARVFFEEASKLDPDNKKYSMWRDVSIWKIDGNELFNVGMDSQDEAKRSKQCKNYQSAIQKYDEALSKLEEAVKKFQDARNKSEDEKFDFSINETRKVIAEINISKEDAVKKHMNSGIAKLNISGTDDVDSEDEDNDEDESVNVTGLIES